MKNLAERTIELNECKLTARNVSALEQYFGVLFSSDEKKNLISHHNRVANITNSTTLDAYARTHIGMHSA